MDSTLPSSIAIQRVLSSPLTSHWLRNALTAAISEGNTKQAYLDAVTLSNLLYLLRRDKEREHNTVAMLDEADKAMFTD